MTANNKRAGDMEQLDDDLFDDDEDTQKDKYLTFNLADEDYAVEIKYVTEIVGIQKITEVPDMPQYIKGVINLRGQVIPVMDVRVRFCMPPRPYNDRTCIIVTNINEITIGLVVDEVREVVDIPAAQIDPPPTPGRGSGSRFLQGIGKIRDEVKIILDVGNLLYAAELSEIVSNLETEE